MMSNIFKASEDLSALRHAKLEQSLFVGIVFVLASASLSGDTLEIVTGLVGALVVYVMKERSHKRHTCATKSVNTPALDYLAVGPSPVAGQKKTKRVKVPKYQGVSSNVVSVHKIVPRLYQAEPRIPLSFADGLPLCKQVDQLLSDLLPGNEDGAVCEELSRLVSPCIRKIIPEAQIDVVAHSSVVRIGRTGLRPEVDLLITAPPNVLAERLHSHMREHAGKNGVRKHDKIMEVDETTLNKFAIRTLSAELKFCKLWRTAYRGVEPKVVLLAPRCLGVLSEDMHVHVYVNCPNTIRSKDVFNQSDKHVQELIAFVRRWAQGRCIANAPHGHMPLYAWTLFAKSFCQSQGEHNSKTSLIDLFGAFVDFHIKWHDSCSQAPAEVAFQIEDPYDAKHNVAECMTPTGMKRFREELERAKRLLASRSSLCAIVEHYNPLVQGTGNVPDADSCKELESVLID